MITDDQKNQIIEVVKNLPVEVLYLFGSQATNTANSLSDFDFAVIFSENIDKHARFKHILHLISDFSEILQKKTDVLDLSEVPIRFQYEALKPRMDIYVKNKFIRDNFENDVLRNYYDQMYYLKKVTSDYLHYFASI